MAGQKIIYQRRDIALTKGGGAGQLQHPGGALLIITDRRQRLLETVKQLTTVVEVNGSRIGEFQTPGGAVKQLGAQLGLQSRHQPAHVGTGHPQVSGGIGEGTPAHHFYKGFNTIPVLHCCYLTIISC